MPTSDMFVTNRTFCNFVVWTEKDLHTKRLTLDDALIRSALPAAWKFFSMCILPNFLGNGTHVQPQPMMNHRNWKKIVDYGAIANKRRVVIWLDVKTGPVPPGGFSWNASACVRFPMANGTAEHVSLGENAKPVV